MNNKKVLMEMLDIYYPEDKRAEEYYIDFMGYKIDDENFPTYHHIEKASDLKSKHESAEATIENGAILGELSHRVLHTIEKYDKKLYDSWNELFLLIVKTRSYPSPEIIDKITKLQVLSTKLIEDEENKKRERKKSKKIRKALLNKKDYEE